MSIKSVFKSAAQTIFTAFGDIPLSSTYTSVGKKELRVHTGKVTSTDTDYTSVNIIYTKYSKSEIDGVNILSSHVKALIPFENLTPTPKKSDKITDSNGEVWGVVDWNKDPADALWIIQLEKVG